MASHRPPRLGHGAGRLAGRFFEPSWQASPASPVVGVPMAHWDHAGPDGKPHGGCLPGFLGGWLGDFPNSAPPARRDASRPGRQERGEAPQPALTRSYQRAGIPARWPTGPSADVLSQEGDCLVDSLWRGADPPQGRRAKRLRRRRGSPAGPNHPARARGRGPRIGSPGGHGPPC